MPETARADSSQATRLTWSIIKQQYPDQWVTLVETDWIDDRSFAFRSTRVIGHGPSRAAAMASARPLLALFTTFGCFYTGRIR